MPLTQNSYSLVPSSGQPSASELIDYLFHCTLTKASCKCKQNPSIKEIFCITKTYQVNNIFYSSSANFIFQKMPVISVLLMVALIFRNISSQQCGNDTYSIYQMMLTGHIFKTFKAQPLSFECSKACNSEVRCQSYNYVVFEDICELNNRTKEARPEDFVKNRDRYYMTKASNRGNAACKR